MSSGLLSATKSFFEMISPLNRSRTILTGSRAALDVPVSTAEPWHIWIKNPDLANHVDFIGTHMLPYWEGIDVDQAVDFVIEHMDMLENCLSGQTGRHCRGRLAK